MYSPNSVSLMLPTGPLRSDRRPLACKLPATVSVTVAHFKDQPLPRLTLAVKLGRDHFRARERCRVLLFVECSYFRIMVVSCGTWSADVHGRMLPSRAVSYSVGYSRNGAARPASACR
jgi:hypothetical protein